MYDPANNDNNEMMISQQQSGMELQSSGDMMQQSPMADIRNEEDRGILGDPKPRSTQKSGDERPETDDSVVKPQDSDPDVDAESKSKKSPEKGTFVIKIGESGKLAKKFDDHALAVASVAGRGVEEVSETYKEKPGILKSLYNRASNAKGGLGRNIFWGVVAILTIKPLVVLPAAFFISHLFTLAGVRKTVSRDIESHQQKCKSLPQPDEKAENVAKGEVKPADKKKKNNDDDLRMM